MHAYAHLGLSVSRIQKNRPSGCSRVRRSPRLRDVEHGHRPWTAVSDASGDAAVSSSQEVISSEPDLCRCMGS